MVQWWRCGTASKCPKVSYTHYDPMVWLAGSREPRKREYYASKSEFARCLKEQLWNPLPTLGSAKELRPGAGGKHCPFCATVPKLWVPPLCIPASLWSPAQTPSSLQSPVPYCSLPSPPRPSWSSVPFLESEHTRLLLGHCRGADDCGSVCHESSQHLVPLLVALVPHRMAHPAHPEPIRGR